MIGDLEEICLRQRAVLARATYQLFAQTVPTVQLMSEIGILALIANLICFLLLISHRNDNINMSSVWLCSRNDILANTSVLLTAGLVFAQSAGKVLTQARAELN